MRSALEVDVLDHGEAEFCVDLAIDGVGALEVAGFPVAVGEAGDVLDDGARVPAAATAGPRADVDQVPGVVVARGPEHRCLGVGQQGEEFVEEAFAAFAAEEVVQAPETRA
nr:hypothetical protein CFP56_72083 [Quercus suber]